jgi:phosphoglycolate phosphatase
VTQRHLFFDLDGTLTDPAPGIYACLLHAARALGHTGLEEADLRRYIGPPLRECFAELLVTRDVVLIEEAVGHYRERFGSVGLFENEVYPGVADALTRLGQAGHPLRVVTSKPGVYADRIIDHFGLRVHFPRVYGAELSGALGTKSELIALALSTEGIVPSDAIMIGDREHDILGAKAQGVAAIGVTWGYGSRAELLDAGAEHVVGSLSELVELLNVLGRLAR